MDADLQAFLSAVKEMTSEVKKNSEWQSKNNRLLLEVAHAFEQLAQGDAKLKVYPLNVTLTRLAVDLEACVMELRQLLQILMTLNKVPALWGAIQKFLR